MLPLVFILVCKRQAGWERNIISCIIMQIPDIHRFHSQSPLMDTASGSFLWLVIYIHFPSDTLLKTERLYKQPFHFLLSANVELIPNRYFQNQTAFPPFLIINHLSFYFFLSFFLFYFLLFS